MQLTISNKHRLDQWIDERRILGRDLVSIKGTPPPGATYGDGELITRPVNVAWQDVSSGEIFAIEYATE